jgi:hypothetical protein
MDNPEKLATFLTQDEEKQNKNTTQLVLNTTIRKQTRTSSDIQQYHDEHKQHF